MLGSEGSAQDALLDVLDPDAKAYAVLPELGGLERGIRAARLHVLRAGATAR